MHLLVLSAFRRDMWQFVNEGFASQCTFWCSVLSDSAAPLLMTVAELSQCTFWCSVLSDFVAKASDCAPCWSSQCTFWCSVLSDAEEDAPRRGATPGVSMHLLVLSAFRQARDALTAAAEFAVSMHLLVLSAFRQDGLRAHESLSQVSMHLLVLSAFRPSPWQATRHTCSCFNAPSGAQCFPTRREVSCRLR